MMVTEKYIIGGMHCAACSASVERVTKGIKGVSESSVNLTTEKMTITYDEKLVSPEIIIKYVESAGFSIEPEIKKKEITSKSVSEKKQSEEQSIILLVISGVFALGLMFLCMGPMLFGISLPLKSYNLAVTEMLLALGIMFINRGRFVSGFKSLFHKAPNMDTLVAVSSSVSFIYSLIQTYGIAENPDSMHNLYFESAGVVLFFVSLGKTMEGRSKKKTKEAIEGLIKLTPLTAMLVRPGQSPVEIKAGELKTGDIVLLQPGCRVPSDCIITEGCADFDESMFTGESLPVHKEKGDKLIGGSVLADGSVAYAQITSVGDDTTLAGIIRFVEDAQGKKAPIASLADRVAGVFVPCVMGIALLAALIWALIGKDAAFVLRIFTTVLVIACPCALGLATPTAIICGTGLGARHGILIRSGESLENCSKTKIAVFDKTGTLTKGQPSVSALFPVGVSEDELLYIASSVEMYSDHPLAKAVYSSAKKRGLDTDDKLNEYIYVSGRGIVAEDKNGDFIYAGNVQMMEEHNVDCSSAADFIENSAGKGCSIICMAKNNKLIGAIALSDEIKPGSKELIDYLKSAGIKTVLLTGDNKKSAQYAAAQLGIDEVYAEVLPQDKAGIVQSLKKDGDKLLMVGDGINDAPALTVADTGCAIGSGSDIAVDSADIVLMKDDPLDAARAIKLSKLTIRNIKQNLFWAFFYNCLGIPVAAGVLYPWLLLTPMIGALAMSFSSVFVVSNALRLRTAKL